MVFDSEAEKLAPIGLFLQETPKVNESIVLDHLCRNISHYQ